MVCIRHCALALVLLVSGGQRIFGQGAATPVLLPQSAATSAQPIPPPAPVAVTTPASNGTWYAAGISGTTPHGSPWSGWFVSGVTQLSKAPSPSYLIVGSEYTIVKNQVASIGFVAPAVPCYALPFGGEAFCMGGIGGAATATNSATTTTTTGGIAYTIGAFGLWPIKKVPTLGLTVGYEGYKTNAGTTGVLHFGLAYHVKQ